MSQHTVEKSLPQSSLLAKVWHWFEQYQHLLIILLTSFLIISSGQLMIGRQLRQNASVWDLSHIYLGIITTVLALSFFIACVYQGRWRQFYPWLRGDLAQLKLDIKGFVRGKIPVAGGKGLFSLVEGLTVLMLLSVCITGVGWIITQGSSDALFWRSYHSYFAYGLIIFICVHIIFALLHLLDFVRD